MALFIIRHGQTVWNQGQILQGHADIPLSARGIEEARQMAFMLKDIPFTLIGASPLLRTRQTGAVLSEILQSPLEICPELLARGYGPWEGKSISKIREEYSREFDEMKLWPLSKVFSTIPFPGIESYETVSQRAIPLLERFAAEAGNCVFVTHTGVVSSILLKLGFSGTKVPLLSQTGFIRIERENGTLKIAQMEGLIDPLKFKDVFIF